jgi:hypothetical protein
MRNPSERYPGVRPFTHLKDKTPTLNDSIRLTGSHLLQDKYVLHDQITSYCLQFLPQFNRVNNGTRMASKCKLHNECFLEITDLLFVVEDVHF